MNINDIIIENEEGTGFCVKKHTFVPNASDEALKELLTEITNNIVHRSNYVANASDSQLIKERQALTTGMFNDCQNVRILCDELLELRKLMAQIQEERDTLADFVAEVVFKGRAAD